MQREQMEISFEQSIRCRTPQRHQRLNRAQWWFKQMRQVVDAAFDWQPAPPPRAEQVHLTLNRSGRPE